MKIGDKYIISDERSDAGTNEFAEGKIVDSKEFLKKESYSNDSMHIRQIQILALDFEYKKSHTKPMHLIYCPDNDITFAALPHWIEEFFILKPKNYNQYWVKLNQ